MSYQIGPDTANNPNFDPYGWHKIPAAWVHVPDQYVDLANDLPTVDDYTGAMMPWDFAVITWPTNHAGPAPGWIGYSGNRQPGETFYMEVAGYALQPYCPGVTAATAPRLCHHANLNDYTYINGDFFETYGIDTSPGPSGGPWWFLTDWRPMAISITQSRYRDLFRCGFDYCYRNIARRIDPTVYLWMQARSSDY